ncbi:MAG TPA: hypothetical protein DCZ63_14875 [Geobacter sp.]|nr:hypothetical protein [Geobacter sp.]
MATAEILLARAHKKIDEPDYDDDDVLDFLNEGLLLATNRLYFPGLQASASVNSVLTGNTVALPTNYQKGLFAARLPNGASLTVKSNLGQILDASGAGYETAGTITMVCEHGVLLAYDRIQTPVTAIKLFYYRKPAAITAETLVLDGITPAVLERIEKAIVHFAAYSAADIQENGIVKLGANHHLKKFNDLIEEVRGTMTVGVSLPPPPIVEVQY